MRKFITALVTIAMLVSLMPQAVFAAQNEGTTLRLVKTEGTVKVENATGKEISYTSNMKLYSNYKITTGAASYAWISLDDSKAAKLDANSVVEVQKSGKKLTLYLSSGELFFNVTSPLNSDESFQIKTSTMTTGIRGTSGTVCVVNQSISEVYMFTGEASIYAENPAAGLSKTGIVKAGQKATSLIAQDAMAQTGQKVDILIENYKEEEVSGSAAMEIASDTDLQQKMREQTDLDVDKIIQLKDQLLAADQKAAQEKQEEIDELAAQQEFAKEVDPLFKESGAGGGGGGGGGAAVQPSSIVTVYTANELLEAIKRFNNSNEDMEIIIGQEIALSANEVIQVELTDGTLTLNLSTAGIDLVETIQNNGNLIITNQQGYLTMTQQGTDALINADGASLTLQNATITAPGATGITNQAGAQFTMTGGTIISQLDISNDTGATVTISGGSLSGDECLENYGTATITGMDLSNGFINYGNATLTNCSATGDGVTPPIINNGEELVIENGSFQGGATQAIDNQQGSLQVTGTAISTASYANGALTNNSEAILEDCTVVSGSDVGIQSGAAATSLSITGGSITPSSNEDAIGVANTSGDLVVDGVTISTASDLNRISNQSTGNISILNMDPMTIPDGFSDEPSSITIVNTQVIYNTLEVPAGKTMTLENLPTITVQDKISNQGTLHVKSGELSIGTNGIENTGELAFEDTQITLNGSGIIMNTGRGVDATFTGGSLSISMADAELLNVTTGNEVTLNNCTVMIGEDCAGAINNQGGTVNILGGTQITGSTSKIIENTGTLVIDAADGASPTIQSDAQIREDPITGDIIENYVVYNTGTFTLGDGALAYTSDFADNKVVVNENSFTMTGGSLTGSSCVLVNIGQTEITGGILENNGTDISQPVIQNELGSTLTLDGGQINSVYLGVRNLSTVTVGQDAKIECDSCCIENGDFNAEGTVNIDGGSLISPDCIFNTNGTVNITGGSLQTEYTGIYNALGEVEMTDGKITTIDGYGIYNESGDITVTGGSIVVTGDGTAIEDMDSVDTTKTLTFGGNAQIEVQTASSPNANSAAIRNNSSDVTISGGTIESDGTYLLHNRYTLNITGGTLSGSAEIFLDEDDVAISGDTQIEGSGDSCILVGPNASVTVSDTVTIENTKSSNAACIIAEGQVEINNGTFILNCSSYGDGSNAIVRVDGDGSVVVAGGKFQPGSYGSGFLVLSQNGNVEMNDGTIEATSTNSRGISISNGTFQMNGGSIEADGNGSKGISLTGGNFTQDGGSIVSTSSGVCIEVLEGAILGTLSLNSGTISADDSDSMAVYYSASTGNITFSLTDYDSIVLRAVTEGNVIFGYTDPSFNFIDRGDGYWTFCRLL